MAQDLIMISLLYWLLTLYVQSKHKTLGILSLSLIKSCYPVYGMHFWQTLSSMVKI